MEIKDARSLSSQAQQQLRVKAVEAVLAGRKQVEVAEMFGVSSRAVGKWIKAYRQVGRRSLRAKPQGRPRGGSLAGWQAAGIAQCVVDRTPDQLKMPFCLWTREAVGRLIERRFGVELSVWTVGRYLKRWGFSPQKPARRAVEQNPKLVRRWLKTTYPQIRRLAKQHRAQIYWCDEMGLRSDDVRGRSWAARGDTPLRLTTGQRFGCNMISAITNRGRLNFMVFKNRFRADVFLEFLNRLVRQAKRKVFLIVDGHPVHRSGKVKKWLKKNAARIRLFFLPPYSPQLNPDEMLNQDVKNNSGARKQAYNQTQLIGNVRGYLRSRQRKPKQVKKYFHAKTVRYAAA